MADRILIAEEDLYQRAMLAGHLSEMDCEVALSATGLDAIKKLEESVREGRKPDLAILDTRLMGRTGTPLFRDVILRHPEIPVVLLSDRGSIGEAIVAMREGAYDYLTKPFESLDDIGFRVSRALERARTLRQNVEFRTHIEYDLEIARSVQHRFLPNSFPHPDEVAFGAHYTACSVIGGDLYDAFALGDRHLGAYIFDVSGHGASAALLTAILKISFQAYVEREGVADLQGDRPTLAALNYLNPMLKRLSNTDQFATLIYAVLDLERSVLSFSSAGHCPAILVHPDGRAEFLKPRQGPPIGITLAIQYHQDEIYFPPGATLLLYTDGILEAADPSGEQWGAEKLLAATATHAAKGPQGLIDAVLAELEHFTRGVANRDDVTALAFRSLGPRP